MEGVWALHVCWGVCVACVCMEERKMEGGREGIKPASWGLGDVGEALGRRSGAADGAVSLPTIRRHSYETTHRFFFCIIYKMLPLSLVSHLASTECQESLCARAHAPDTNTCLCVRWQDGKESKRVGHCCHEGKKWKLGSRKVKYVTVSVGNKEQTAVADVSQLQRKKSGKFH